MCGGLASAGRRGTATRHRLPRGEPGACAAEVPAGLYEGRGTRRSACSAIRGGRRDGGYLSDGGVECVWGGLFSFQAGVCFSPSSVFQSAFAVLIVRT